MTLAIGLYDWVSDERNAHWGLFTAGAVVAAIPVLVLFLFLQRYIVSRPDGGVDQGLRRGATRARCVCGM